MKNKKKTDASSDTGARKSRSEKHHAVEYIFNQLWDEQTQTLTRIDVTFDDITNAIHWSNEHRGTKLSSRNPANFIKDVIRGPGGSRIWPEKLKKLRWSAEQVTGKKRVFQFVPYKDSQTEPFPVKFEYRPEAPTHEVESLTMPMAVKRLSRKDEPWLIQVAVRLRIVEMHFALHSSIDVLELNHLQWGIKLRDTEIDSLFAAEYRDAKGDIQRLAITCEAKTGRDRILEGQIVRQVKATFRTLPDVNMIAPITLVAHKGGIYVAEFEAINREGADALKNLALAADSYYIPKPAVPGI